MKTTNNKRIISDKLQGVDLPDMDAAWQKMERSLEAVGPVQSGWSAFIAKYKLYLNLFIAATTIGFIGLYVKSKTHEQNPITIQLKEEGSFVQHNVNYLTFQTVVDHTNDLPLPSLPAGNLGGNFAPQITETPYMGNVHFDQNEESETTSTFDLPTETAEDEDSTKNITTIELEIIKPFTLLDHYERPVVYIHNQVGVKVQLGVLPNYSTQNALRNTGVSIFVRRFVNPRSAIHVELGYNPISISPTTYVEQYNVFNNFNYTQTDSAVVKRLKYVTIPINWHYQLRPNFSLTVGPQVSFLTGLSGDITRKMRYPTAPETDQLTENTSIQNRGGFNNYDIGLNLEFDFHVNRFEIGLRVQQGLVDYSTDDLSTQTHRNSALQIKAACLLSK